MNSSNMSDICEKLNFITNHTYVTIDDIHFIKKHIHLIIFDTCNGTTFEISALIDPASDIFHVEVAKKAQTH